MYNSAVKLNFKKSTLFLRGFASFPEPLRQPKLPNTKLFINNEWVNSVTGEEFDAYNPTNGEVITRVSKGTKEDVDVAVQAAKEAFKLGSTWRKMDASKRGRLLINLAELVERDAVLLASLSALECGKVYSTTLKGDLPWASSIVRYYAGWTDKNNGYVAPIDGNYIAYTRNEPVGVCGLLVAWNFSVFMTLCKMSQACAAGCTMVLKPSQSSTLSTLHLAELVKEAGFPPGVINFVYGLSDVGAAIADHPEIDKISFTGSTTIGQEIYQKGASTMKRLTLELGGKSPNIILKDADVDKAVEHAHFASFHNMGQCCCAGSRTLVHESIYEEFVQKSKERIKKVKVGNPFDLDVNHGPQGSKAQVETITRYVETAKKEGGHVEIGGNRVEGPGYFFEPTLFTNVKDDHTIYREEIFGPVQQISPYKTLDEAIHRANDTHYGLASSVYGQNIDEINTVAQALRAGSVWVNCYFQLPPQTPFGGFKMSGIGREGGSEGLAAFTEPKVVIMKTPTKNS